MSFYFSRTLPKLSSWGLPTFRLESEILDYFLYYKLFHIFLYMLKTMTFSRSITKQPASTLKFQYFYSILQMNFCGPRQKRGERPFSAGTSCTRADLWPVVTPTLSTSKIFQTFLRHCWQPCSSSTISHCSGLELHLADNFTAI